MDGGKQPAMQVVGFRVEGVQPSPDQHQYLLNEHRSGGTGSPTPVIIPPSFQPAGIREPTSLSGARAAATEAAAAKAVQEAGTAVTPVAGSAAPPAVIIPPNSSSTQSVDTPGGTSFAVPSPTPVTPTAAPAAPAATPTPAMSQPKAILQSERAEAGHVGLQRQPSPSAESDSASVVSGVSTNIFRTDESQYNRSNPSPGAQAAASPARHHHSHAQAKPAAGAAARASATAVPPSSGLSTIPSAGVTPVGSVRDAGSVKEGPAGNDKPKSQKEMTKAERRALQEQQRAAKAAAQASGGKAPAAGGSAKKEAASAGGGVARTLDTRASGKSQAGVTPRDERVSKLEPTVSASGMSVEAGALQSSGALHHPAKAKKQQGARVVSLNPTEMFAHLQQFKQVTEDTILSIKDAQNMPEEVLQLGMRYADGTISGASARCMAMLHVFCQVIENYSTPTNARLNRDLTTYLNTIIDFLVKCRPLALSMGNAIKWLKLKIAAIPTEMPEAEAKEQLIGEIRDFIRNRIEQAQVWLSHLAAEKVDEGDVILTYAYSHIVSEVLLEALRPTASPGQGSDRPPKRFRVVVVDSRPEQEGRIMLKKLQAAGIACTYAHMNALSFVMQDVTKVFLGASAIMSNGTVMSRAGTAAVAMMAHAHSKPVIVCCESYKFHERVQLDAITHNELGDPDVLSRVEGQPEVTALKQWRDSPRLALLNLKYDAMPAQYVTAIVTEHALIPPTSVPVVIREYMAMSRE